MYTVALAGGFGIFGPMDPSWNDRERFAGGTCQERLYDSHTGNKHLARECSCDACPGVPCNTTIPCEELCVEPEGVIFRADVPNGLYRFVGAIGDPAFDHAHRILAEDGGSGPPTARGDNFVVLVRNFDQNQYNPGAVFARIGFDGLQPPPGDGRDPDPRFVNMSATGMRTPYPPDSPTLEVTQGYIRIHQLQGNSNDGIGGEAEPPGGDIVVLELWRVGPAFKRGDANADGLIDVSDAVHVLAWLFLGGPPPPCKDAADINNDSDILHDPARIDLSDPVYLLSYLFLGGPPPPAPGPHRCGPDPVEPEDELDCESYEPCE
jgi:hypothetical protein